jgi:hypothetical protein
MYHLLIPVAVAAAYALGLIALSYSAIQEWIKRKSVAHGYVDIIREQLANGRYTVVAGAFSHTGRSVARETWGNVKIDERLRSQFGEKNVIRIQT